MIGALAAHHGDAAATSGETLLVDAFGAEPWAYFLLAQDQEGAPVGYAALLVVYQAQFARRSVDLHHLFVAPAARGRGVGRALVEAAAEWARVRSAVRLTVGTHPDNARARSYYERLGFSPLPAGGARFAMRLD
ncbi:MAG: GNAT family N-acetyltransferase [Rhodoblastus sp.]|nr:MAG: GNAT family N-acetyltransferase [Rhodoblastus sp.]